LFVLLLQPVQENTGKIQNSSRKRSPQPIGSFEEVTAHSEISPQGIGMLRERMLNIPAIFSGKQMAVCQYLFGLAVIGVSAVQHWNR